MNLFTNLVVYVPKILISHRYNGVLFSILIGTLLGLFLMYLFTSSMEKFPGRTQADIVSSHLPKWISSPYLFLVAILFFGTGYLILNAFIEVSKRFINPDMPNLVAAILFTSFVIAGAAVKSDRLLYFLEIILFFNLPLLLLVLVLAYINPFLSWDSIRTLIPQARFQISWESIGASCYTLLGFFYLATFNKFFSGKGSYLNWYRMILIGLLGLSIVLTSIVIPVGVAGIDGINSYVYPWISTTDSLQMEYGIIERVLFIFLFFHICISLIGATVSWHVSLDIFKAILPKIKFRQKNVTSYLVSFVFFVGVTTTSITLNIHQQLQIAKVYYISLIPASILSVALMYWIARRKRA
ncbi:GerAB/ArcD/ProY family transporter [Pontibacillus marinus]|uniref:GerAB/ArcD/ProY family transporter n=1 Tax=Pontibacillus marinus TaxID=273164 RepID=UPI0018CF2F9C|nr:GerAB/ArcD/ProY family transporter [Pontibacillus marinus]